MHTPLTHASPGWQSVAALAHGTLQRCVCMLQRNVPHMRSLWHGGASGFAGAAAAGGGAAGGGAAGGGAAGGGAPGGGCWP